LKYHGSFQPLLIKIRIQNLQEFLRAHGTLRRVFR
jgi:hypothetical protein